MSSVELVLAAVNSAAVRTINAEAVGADNRRSNVAQPFPLGLLQAPG